MKPKTTRAVRVPVSVTSEMIQAAIPKDSAHCMIADAVLAAVPDAKKISVDLQTIRFTDPKKKVRYTYLTPRCAQVALVNFDQGRLVEPFDFKLRGGQVTLAGSPKTRERAGPTLSEEERARKAASAAKARQHIGKARLRAAGNKVAEKIGGQTPPLQQTSDGVPFTRRRAFGLRALEL